MKQLRLVTKRLSDLLPEADTQTLLPGLQASLEELGDLGRIIWNRRSGNVVDGRKRLKVLLALGLEEYEVGAVDYSPAQEKAARLVLNELRQRATEAEISRALEEIEEDDPDLFAKLDLDAMVDGMMILAGADVDADTDGAAQLEFDW